MGSWLIFKSCRMCAQAEGADDRTQNDRERRPRASGSHPAATPMVSCCRHPVCVCKRKIPASSETSKTECRTQAFLGLVVLSTALSEPWHG